MLEVCKTRRRRYAKNTVSGKVSVFPIRNYLFISFSASGTIWDMSKKDRVHSPVATVCVSASAPGTHMPVKPVDI
jgi:hypothetical protein